MRMERSVTLHQDIAWRIDVPGTRQNPPFVLQCERFEGHGEKRSWKLAARFNGDGTVGGMVLFFALAALDASKPLAAGALPPFPGRE